MLERLRRWTDGANYSTILLLLVAWLIVVSIAGETAWGRVASSLLAGASFGLGIRVAGPGSKSGVALLGVLAVLVVHNAAVAFRGPRTLSLIFAAATLFYTIYVPIAMVRHALRARRVDFDVIMGALCAYILLGVAWGAIYVILEGYSPGSFHSSDTEPIRRTLMYFSFVTLTTLGYGDVAPVSAMARSLSVMEALFGQVYLVVLVARLVGLYTQHSNED